MELTIDKKFLGSDKNLLIKSDSFVWTDDTKEYHYTGNEESSIGLVLELQNITLPQIPDSVKCMSNSVFKNHQCDYIPWKKIVTNDFYKDWLIKIVKDIKNSINESTLDYYETSWSRHSLLFDSFQQTKINQENLRNFLLEKNANKTNLMSFFPNKDGYAQLPKYDRLSTRTGRLKIKSGPSILLLKKEQRKILKSHYENGKIISIDYSSLEARIAYQLKNKVPAEDDLYEYIRKLVGNEFQRHQIKLATISLLYGMNEQSLIASLGGKDKAKLLLKEIKKIFKIKSLNEELREKANNSSIKNFYGRCIQIPEERLILNTYIQSTGVDIALHGFTNLVESLKGTLARPLFVLHDALILDIPHDFDIEKFKHAAEHIPKWDVKFPVQITSF